MTTLSELAPAKINLTLRIVGRRPDGYHELESLVAFADCADRLTLTPGVDTSLDVTGPFAAACGNGPDNLVLKAAARLSEHVPGLTGGQFRLEKLLPVAAGIGGGSSDAAAALRLLARANDLAPDDSRLAQAAIAVGADVPVCLDPRARIMRGIGEILGSALDLSRLPAVLVNPGVATNTRDVFARFAVTPQHGAPLSDLPRADLSEFLRAHGNDLTPAALVCVPAIGEVLDTLDALPQVELARMSGSGATCFALFASGEAARSAAERVRKAHPEWWVAAATLG